MDKETLLTRKRYNRTSKFYDIMDRMIKPDLRKKILKQFLMLTLYVTLHFTFINPIELPALQSAPQDLALQSVPQAQALQPVPQALAAEPRFLSHL